MTSRLFLSRISSHLHPQTTSFPKPTLSDTTVVVTALCNSFREGRDWDTLTREFRSLKLNDSSLVELVLSQLNDAKAALRFFHWSAKRINDATFHHTTRSYTITINHLLLNSLTLDARALLESLAKRNPFPRAALTVVASLLDTCHQAVAPLAVNILIQTYAKAKLTDATFAVCRYVEEDDRGFSVSAVSFNALLHALQRSEKKNNCGGSVWEAIALLREMEGNGLRPYGETFEHVIVGCATVSDLERCVSVFEEMVRAGFVPGCVVFNKVVMRLCEKGKVAKANEMLTVLLDKGFLPDDATYAHLMQGYADKEEVQEVLKLYYEMEYRCMSPRLSVFATIVRCLCHCGKVEDAEKYLRIMKGRLLKPDVSLYKVLIDGYMMKGEDARALRLRNEMASLEL